MRALDHVPALWPHVDDAAACRPRGHLERTRGHRGPTRRHLMVNARASTRKSLSLI